MSNPETKDKILSEVAKDWETMCKLKNELIMSSHSTNEYEGISFEVIADKESVNKVWAIALQKVDQYLIDADEDEIFFSIQIGKPGPPPPPPDNGD